MRVLVFVTDDGSSAEGSGPILMVGDTPQASLPAHPRGLAWKYFATIGLGDSFLASEREAVETAISQGLTYISRRLVHVPAAK